MIYLLVILAQLCDLLTFFCAASVLSIQAEANPLARWAHATGGMYGVAALKVTGTGVVMVGMSMLEGWQLTALVGIAVAIGLFGAVVNTAALLVSR